MARRLLTVPLYLLVTLALTSVAPVLVVVLWLLSFVPRFRGILRTFSMFLAYLWYETVGIFASFIIWARYRGRADYLAYNHRLQCWWASTLKKAAERIYGLSFRVSGATELRGSSAIMLARHTSIADTFIPMVWYAIPEKVRLRYVLKKELLLDPCLDIVGNRLSNYFVDRGGQDTERAVAGVAALAGSLGPGDGLLFYPEGTRFSHEKRELLSTRWSDRPELMEQLSQWPNLLPPRLGGSLALLKANPGHDLLFLAHTGFEESGDISNLIDGSWPSGDILIHFWRVPFDQVPGDDSGRREFLFEQWDLMDRWVADHSSELD